MPVDAAVFASSIRLLAEFDVAVLAGESLPTLGRDPWRIDTTGGKLCGAADYSSGGVRTADARGIAGIEGTGYCLDAGRRRGVRAAISIFTVHRTRNAQARGDRDYLSCIRHV